jgi:hypothetical protein
VDERVPDLPGGAGDGDVHGRLECGHRAETYCE